MGTDIIAYERVELVKAVAVYTEQDESTYDPLGYVFLSTWRDGEQPTGWYRTSGAVHRFCLFNSWDNWLLALKALGVTETHEGTLGPQACTRLREDFRVSRARKPRYHWFRDITAEWIKAFDLAATHGAVTMTC